MARAVDEIFRPVNVIDVGCATGDIIKALRDRGINAYGLEGSDQVLEYLEVDPEFVTIQDLRFPLEYEYTGGTFDFVSCLEVAEHIEPKFASQFLDNLVGFAPEWILLTAAPPGQDGHYHVNCRPPGFWIGHFMSRNYYLDGVKTSLFKSYLIDYKHKKGIKAYYENVMAFKKGEKI